MNLSSRLDRLESRAAAFPVKTTAKDAAEFKASIINMARRFEESECDIPKAERATRFSQAQELAWAMRFGAADEFKAALKATLAYAKGMGK